MALPKVSDLLEARAWLQAGAPAASRHHDGVRAVTILYELIESLPEHIPMYCYGTEENRAANRAESKQFRKDAFDYVQSAFNRLEPFELETLIDRLQDNEGTLEQLFERAKKKDVP
jgi:hypothetical protein